MCRSVIVYLRTMCDEYVICKFCYNARTTEMIKTISS